MKKLYRVDAFWYVMAEDKEEAVDYKPMLSECSKEASLASEVGVDYPDWWEAIPFNSDDDRTCGQIQHDIRERQ